MHHCFYSIHVMSMFQSVLIFKKLTPICRYELHISEIRLLDFYGGAADLKLHEYFMANVSCSTANDMHTLI